MDYDVSKISTILKIDRNLMKEKLFELLSSDDILPKSKIWTKNLEQEGNIKLYWFLPEEIVMGNGVNPFTKDVDTGLGHRLFFLLQGILVNKLFNDRFTLILEERYWPERKFLNFPQNIIFTSNYEDINSAVNIPREKFLDIFLFKNFDYILNQSECSFKFDNNLDVNCMVLEFIYRMSVKSKYYDSKVIDYFPLDPDARIEIRKEISDIKFSFKDANEFLKKKFLNHIGLYVRRSNVPMSIKHVNTLPENIRDDFYNDYGKYNIERYKPCSFDGLRLLPTQFIPDEIHFKKIEQILKDNSKQKFYLCCDVKTKYVQHYKDKYPENIVLRDDIILEFSRCFPENFFKENNYILSYLMDLFALSSCSGGIVYEFKGSHWTYFAEQILWANSIPSPYLIDWNDYIEEFLS